MESRIDLSTFRELLRSLENSDISIRLRISGEGWMDFTKLILLSESAMIVQDGSDHRVIMNVRDVVECQIDQPLLDLAPLTSYEIAY